jgi:MoaA/NifB/PqqE/SkfB family radical SAM enzyme
LDAAHNKGNCTIGVGFVTSAQQRHDIVPFTKLWQDVPIDYIQYRPLQDYNGVHWQSDDAATAAEIAKAAELDNRVVYSDLKYLAVSGIHQALNGRTEKCYGVMFATSISADGKVYVCCHLKGNPAGAIGDLYVESFSDIWHRHCHKRSVQVIPACPSLCRHYLTNVCITEHIAKPATHPNFI